MLLQNPSSSPQLRAAVKAFEKFHGVKPREIIELPGSGPPLIGMGTLREVVYQPTRGERAGPAFFHKFGRGAAVAATADGKVVVLVPSKGKPFRVDWDRGLIG